MLKGLVVSSFKSSEHILFTISMFQSIQQCSEGIYISLVPIQCFFYVSLLLLLLSCFSRQTLRPHRRQPTRLPHPWDSPGKNTGVGCHFLLQCMKVKSESEAAQLCPTRSDPRDCCLPGSSIHGIFQARVLEWGAIAFSVVSPYAHASPIYHSHLFPR